jgi:FixJ family two-component response regulator
MTPAKKEEAKKPAPKDPLAEALKRVAEADAAYDAASREVSDAAVALQQLRSDERDARLAARQ